MRSRLLLGSLLVAVAIAFGAGEVAADNCSSPGDCEETAGYNTIIAVVGGVAAVSAAAAAAVAATTADAAAGAAGAAGGDGSGDGSGEDEEPPEVVIVQVEPGDIDVSPDEPGQVAITAWRVNDEGNPVRAPDIPLEISAGTSALQLTPASGAGQIIVQVELVAEPTTDVAVLTATGSSKGKSASAQVTVHLGGGYELELY